MTDRCLEIRQRLHDWVDDLLDEPARRALADHLEGCDGCRDELAALEALRAEAGALPQRIEPRHDLWPAIEARLAVPWWRRLLAAPSAPAGFRLPPAVLAAVGALAALALGVWLWRAEPEPAAQGPSLAAEEAAKSEAGFEARAELARSEDGMLLPRRDLLEAVQRQKDHLQPETVAVLEENMRILDQAIGQIRTALDDDPLNQQLHGLLAAHYLHEVQLLKRVSGV